MFRRNRLAAFLLSGSLLVISCLFEPVIQSLAAEQPATVVGNIAALAQKQGVSIQIPLEGSPVQPMVARLENPHRIVLDFIGAVPVNGIDRRKVSMAPVLAVRTALFEKDSQGRPVTRVVIDLSQRAEFKTSAEAGKFVVTVLSPRPNDVTSSTVNTGAAAKLMPSKKFRSGPPIPDSSILNQLHNIEVSSSVDSTVVMLGLDRVDQFSVLLLQAPTRFVVDLPETVFAPEWNKAPTINVDTPLLKSIRISKSSSRLRLVFDQPTSISPQISRLGSRLMLDFRSTESSSVTPPKQESNSPAASQENCAAMTRPPKEASSEAATTTAQQQPPAAAVMRIRVSPPVVQFENGLLTVDANNSTLTDVLYAISEKTGTVIQLPFTNGVLDRVDIKIGPSSPKVVLATILEGSAFNYYFVEANGKVEKVLLVPR